MYVLQDLFLAGAPKTVEFDFDLAADTAYSVANEMVSDLSLSHEDAKVVRAAHSSCHYCCNKLLSPY